MLGDDPAALANGRETGPADPSVARALDLDGPPHRASLGWHVGHQYVVRWILASCAADRTRVPQRRHGRPARRYTHIGERPGVIPALRQLIEFRQLTALVPGLAGVPVDESVAVSFLPTRK